MKQTERLFTEGQKFHIAGNLAQAMRCYEKALSINPNLPDARMYKALVLQQSGRIAEAIAEGEKAYSILKNDDIPVLVTYGILMKNANRLDDAKRAYQRVLKINPNIQSAIANLSTIDLLQGNLIDAEIGFKKLAKTMKDASPWLNLARIALIKAENEKAAEYLIRAEDFDPLHPDLLMLKAKLASDEKDYESAFEYCIKGLEKSPSSRELWQQLQMLDSSVFKLNLIEERLQELSNKSVESISVLSIAVDLCRKNWLWKSLEKLEKKLSDQLCKNLIDRTPSPSDVFTLLGSKISQENHLKIATECWSKITSLADRKKFNFRDKIKKSKIRVGFLSSDLRGHAIGYLAVGLFENLPKESIEWWAYSNSNPDDDVSNRLRSNFDRFICVNKLNDIELAEKIYQDDIDVIIELNQMTAMTRATALAYRPAPVQIQWLGMPGSLGAGSDIDYVIVDPWVVTSKNQKGFSEKFIFLPRSYQPNDHVKPAIDKICESRSEAGLPENGVILGVFNQYYKFSPDTIKLWGEIFRQINNAYLWLLSPNSEQLQEKILQELSFVGINSEQIIFAEQKPQKEHLARLRWMDLVLDTWPYNAHTTCSDALRAGVPVLTLPGDTFASRVASGILNTAQLNNWIATSSEEYVKKAVKFANQSREKIEEEKQKVREIYWSSEMVDNKKLGSQIELICLELYRQFTEGLETKSQKVTKNLTIEPYSSSNEQDQFNDINLKISDDKFYPGRIDDPSKKSEVPNSNLIAPSDWISLIKQSGGEINRHTNYQILSKFVFNLSSIPLMIDIGAADLGEKMKFNTLADAGLISIIGFEPNPEEFKRLNQNNYRKYLPHFIGDGRKHTFNICTASGMSSLLKPSLEFLDLFPQFTSWGNIESSFEVETTRLDDIESIRGARFAKFDIQGAESLALEHGENFLKGLSFLQIESSPYPLYKNEKNFFQISQWLMDRGFIFHTFQDMDKRNFKPFVDEENPYAFHNHILQFDAVFMPNPLHWGSLPSDQLLGLGFLSHILFEGFDVTMRALEMLDQRDGKSRVGNYKNYLNTAGLYA